MKHRFLSIALFTLYLPHLITAQCSACDSYSAALKSCQTTSANITEVGNTMDTKSVHCMCVSSSSASEMNACQGCDESNINLNLDDVLLLTWYQTCKADSQWGDQQAIACWEGQPINLLPCIENTGGKGSGTTPGGSGLTTGSASSPSTTAAPSTKAKSEAMMSSRALGLSSVMIIGLGVVLSV